MGAGNPSGCNNREIQLACWLTNFLGLRLLSLSPTILYCIISFLPLQNRFQMSPKTRFFHITILHLLGQTFAPTPHNTLSHAKISARFALPVLSALFSKALTDRGYRPMLTPFRIVHLSFQTYRILLFNSKALVCGNFPMADAF